MTGRHNHRIERTFTRSEFTLPGGDTISVEYVSHEQTTYDVHCPECGIKHSPEGMIYKLLNGDLCELCRPPYDNELPDLTENAIDELRL